MSQKIHAHARLSVMIAPNNGPSPKTLAEIAGPQPDRGAARPAGKGDGQDGQGGGSDQRRAQALDRTRGDQHSPRMSPHRPETPPGRKGRRPCRPYQSASRPAGSVSQGEGVGIDHPCLPAQVQTGRGLHAGQSHRHVLSSSRRRKVTRDSAARGDPNVRVRLSTSLRPVLSGAVPSGGPGPGAVTIRSLRTVVRGSATVWTSDRPSS